METALIKTYDLNHMIINKSICINIINSFDLALNDVFISDVSFSFEITSFDYDSYSFESIDEIKNHLSNRIEIAKFSISVFFGFYPNRKHVCILFRPDCMDKQSYAKYILDIYVKSNDAIDAENLLQIVSDLFSNGEFVFCNTDNYKSGSGTAENITINIPPLASVETTTSNEERQYQEHKEKRNFKSDLFKALGLLLAGAVITKFVEFIFSLL